MFRLILHLACLPLLFLSAALLMIRAQSYDNRDVQAFLLPDGCTSPCFMGIQPGITKPQDALSQLRSTESISRVGVSESLETIAWFWNENHSGLMDSSQIPALFYDRDEISSIRLYTRIRLGDLMLQMDTSGSQRIAMRQTTPYTSFNVDLYYVGKGYVLNAVVNCHDFWNQPTQLILGTTPLFLASTTRTMTSLNTAKHLIDAACRRRKET
ncbi:MAG: hypothetical protein GC179_12565 [Anaerolineaceae bacterium]|nr:hypothetical protein [Anaerolineaceae bacterium]